MTFKELKNKIKEEQKSLAQQIKRGKSIRKPCDRKNITDKDKDLYYSNWECGDGFAYWKIGRLSNYYRHIHIAYCMLFYNTPYEQIELPREDNNPNKSRLDKIRKEWESQIDEVIRDRA